MNQLAGAHRNLLVNGGFEVWQRGAGTFSAGAAYTADRWQMGSGSTIAIDRESSIVDSGSQYSLKFVVSSFLGSALIQQVLNDLVPTLRGREVAFSCRVHQGTASRITLDIQDSSGTSSSSSSATTGSFVTLSVARTLGAAITTLLVDIRSNGTGTFYFDNAMLVIGPAPAPYQPVHPQEDLARCQRYYEAIGGASTTIYVAGYQAAGANAGATLFFKVAKGGTPTVTKNGTWSVTNCAQPTVGGASVASCYIDTVVTALGAFSFLPNSADDFVEVVWNP